MAFDLSVYYNPQGGFNYFVDGHNATVSSV